MPTEQTRETELDTLERNVESLIAYASDVTADNNELRNQAAAHKQFTDQFIETLRSICARTISYLTGERQLNDDYIQQIMALQRRIANQARTIAYYQDKYESEPDENDTASPADLTARIHGFFQHTADVTECTGTICDVCSPDGCPQ